MTAAGPRARLGSRPARTRPLAPAPSTRTPARLDRVRVALALALVAGLILPALAPAPAVAAGLALGTPTANATYGTRIDFSVPLTAASPPARVELRLGFPQALGPYVIDVPVTGGGSQTLHYSLDVTGGGHLAPNTPISYSWAAFAEAGSEPVLSPSGEIRYADTTKDWQSLKGDLITVHWYAGSRSFAQKALRIGEQAVRDTSALLGVTETDRIDFFIYGDQDAFRAALGPGTRENVGGQARTEIRTLFALIPPDAVDDPWVGVVVPHELTHVVFDTAVRNPYRFPPRWLNEGLAVYLSEGYGSADRSLVADAVGSGDLIPLVALGAQFPTDAAKTSLAYAESVSAIDYLVRQKGRDALIALVLAYKGGLTDDEAFTKALGQDLSSFQAGWLAELGARTPQQFGPQPAPAGPLPSGWSGAPPGSGAGPGGSAAPGGTPRPAVTSEADAPAPAEGTRGTSAPLLLGVLALVVVVVIAAVLLARRRSEPL